MRILLVANTLPPDDISGVGEQVLQLAAGLETLGHEVRVLGRQRSGIGANKFLFPLTVVPFFRRELLRFRPHIVQVHESDGGLAILLAAVQRSLLSPQPRLSALLQVSYLEEFRSIRALRDGGRVLGRPGARELRFKLFSIPVLIVLGRLTAYLADVVMSPSRQTGQEVARDYGVDRVGVLPNVMGGREVALEDDTTLGQAEGFLLYVGRLRIRKAVEVLLESLASTGEEGPELLLVGDGEHGPRLRRCASHLGLDSRVRFLGRRSPGQVRLLMRRAGALVVPSIYEGMPLVVLEAMEAELPVIASRVSGIPEVVSDGETGWLVPPEDPVALAEAIRQWRADPAEAKRRGRAGRHRLEDLYSAEDVARVWIEQVVEKNHPLEAQSASPAAVRGDEEIFS